ncbi:MAG: hypothetical protein EOM66_12090, partial [Clostridia bacterium]|nr:hypothetical protein [Clostridia bacterium]
MLSLAVGLMAFLALKPGGKSGSLSAGNQTLSLPASAIIIRSESCVSVEKYDRVSYEVQEGAQVTAEMPVAVVYKWGYTDDMTQALLNVQQQIYAKQLELLGGVENAELTSLNAQVTAKQQEIRTILSGNAGSLALSVDNREQDNGDAAAATEQTQAEQTADLLTIEKDMKALLSQRCTLLQQCVQADEALNSLYADAETKKTQLAEYTSEVAAKGSGVVSFYFDGYEQVLNANKLEVLNADLVNKVLGNVSAGDTTGTENLLYRLVEPSRWYMAFVTPREQALRLCSGQVYAVAVEGYPDKQFMGTALDPVVNENGVVNILEFGEDIGALISVRSVKATLTAQMSGMKVPLSAIGFENGVPMLMV